MKYLFDGVSLKNGRAVNMDCLLLKERTIKGKDVLIAAVCDGVGSTADGAYASSTVVRMLSEWFDGLRDTERAGLRMRDEVSAINHQIISKAITDNLDTASTLSALLLSENKYYIVHVGDSRIYNLTSGTLSLLTKDDVTTTGKLTACIGKRNNLVQFYSEGLIHDNTFLLCSDGLYKRMDFSFMLCKMYVTSKKSLAASMDAMTKFVIERGERDNISVSIIKTKQG